MVVGSADPNPLVAGKGIALLRAHGIEVTEAVAKEECDRLNRSFFHFIQTHTPYVVLKYAMTMDGKTATHTGQSRWITGELARQRVHEDRHRYAGILVGIGTALADDPLLTCRLEHGRNPLRIVCDTALRLPLTAKLVSTAHTAQTLIATAVADPQRHAPYLQAGCDIAVLGTKDGSVDLNALMQELGKRQIDSVLVEGGSTLSWSALQSGIVHTVQAYVAPKLFGGNGSSPVAGIGVAHPNEAFRLRPPSVTVLGEDILLESEVIACSPES